MHRYDPARRKLALGLAFLAGAVDATGFIRTGGYFASFMSGNTTRLGLHIAGQPSIAYIPFALICGFVTGVVLGSLLASHWPDWRKRALLAAVTLGQLTKIVELMREILTMSWGSLGNE